MKNRETSDLEMKSVKGGFNPQFEVECSDLDNPLLEPVNVPINCIIFDPPPNRVFPGC